MTFYAGDLVTVDFPGVTGVKRRPAVILSSETYHSLRPDVIVGLITTQTKVIGITDYTSGLGISKVVGSFDISLLYRNVTSVCKFSYNWAFIRA
jgi:mRNA interferase MazF